MIRRPWLLVGLLSATATAAYLCRVNLSVVGVLVMRDLGLTQVQMGRLFSAFLVTYALSQVPAGLMADRWGARRVLTIAAWWWVASTLVQALAGTTAVAAGTAGAVAVLLAGRLLLGIGEAPAFTAAAQGISRWMDAGAHARANGLVIAAVGLGSAIAPPLLAWAMLRVGWRGALVVSAVPAAIIAVVWQFVRVPPAPGEVGRGSNPPLHDSGTGTSDRVLGALGEPALPNRIPRRQFALLTLSYTLQGYVGYIFVFWFYLYLVQERRFDVLQGALVGSLPWVLTILSVPLGGAIADRLVRPRGTMHAAPAVTAEAWRWRVVPVAGLVGAGGFIVLGAHTANPWIAAVALAGATGLVMCVEGPFWSTMTRLSGGKAGAAGGIMNMGCNLGGLVSPALTPIIASRVGWALALDVAAVLSVVGGLLWLGIAPGDARRPATAPPGSPGAAP